MNKLKVLLGISTNLLNGLDPSWMSPANGNDALFKTTTALPNELLETVSGEQGKWSFPDVTLHPTPESLLNALLPYSIKNPADTLETAEIQTGSLMIGDKDRKEALRTLSTTLGVDLTKTGSGYALVRLRRTDCEIFHSSIQGGYLAYVPPTQAPKILGKAASQLKRQDIRQTTFMPDTVTPEEAREYLNFFYEHGTHYVSGAVVGDEIFQVFQFPPKPYEHIKKIYEKAPQKLSGVDAVLFIQFTAPYKNENYGYAEKYGHLLSLSQDKRLTDPAELQNWNDEVYSQKASIFMPFRMGGGVSLASLNTDYIKQTAIEIHLTSLTLFMEYSRRRIWERVFKGAILQKYQTAVRPNFHVYFPKDKWQKLQQSGSMNTLSTLCTPEINLYIPVVNLESLCFSAPHVVNNLTLTTQVLPPPTVSNICLPGKDVLINAQTIALESENVLKITLKNEAYDRLELYNQHFYGALIISNQSDTMHYTLSDGLRYEYEDGVGERYHIRIAARVNKPMESVNVKNMLRAIDGIQFLSSFTESMYGVLDPTESTRILLKESFRWVTQLIPEGCTTKEWLSMRLNNLDMLHAEAENSLGTFVPVLSAERYEKEILPILDYIDVINKSIDIYDRQIEHQKQLERMGDIGNTLNKNIIASGKLLCEYIQANMNQQEKLAEHYESIIKGKKAEQESNKRTIATLWTELNEKRSEFLNLALNYEQAVNDKLKQETIKNAILFVFTAAKGLFSLGVTIATPASSISEVADFNAVVQRIQKFINVTTALDNIITGTSKDITSLADAQKQFDGLTDLVTSNLSWDELTIKFEEILARVPAELENQSLKTQLVSTFKLFILKGKAYSSARSSYNTIAKEIYQQQGMQQLVEDQAKKLQELTKTLDTAHVADLEVSKIDLMGLTGRLCVVRTNMLGILSKTFVQHDQSLQYTNMQPGTVIRNFSLEGILQARVEQTKKTNDSLTELQRFQPFETNKIDIPIEIPVSELRGGGIHSFRIWNDFRYFQPFCDAKIKSVVARIDGIESTDSGQYALRIAYNGRPFFNKGLDGNFMPFHTLERGHAYPYEVASNRPLFSDHGESWSENVTMVTPYSVWEISLPRASNAGLRFWSKSTVTVTLTFTLQARIKDVMLAKDIHVMPSVEEVINSMAGSSKLQEWDVVFNMLLDNINSVLEKQYDELKEKQEYKCTIKADSLTKISTMKKYSIDECAARTYTLTYGYPSLEFLTNSDQKVKLSFTINGSIQSGTKWIGDVCPENRSKLENIANALDIDLNYLTTEIIDKKEKLVLSNLGEPETIDKEVLTAIIKLSTIKGLVNKSDTIMSVVLNMAEGTFQAECFENKLTEDEHTALNDAVQTYFKNNPVYFIINSLDISKITTLDDLKPNQFLFKALKTSSNHEILQLFIHTNKREITDYDYSHTYLTCNADPIPLGYQTSLIISNRLMFNSILPASIKEWILEGEDEGERRCSKFIKAAITGEVNLSNLNHDTFWGDQCSSKFEYEPKDKNPVSWELNGMRISSQKDGTVGLSYLQKQKFYVTEKCTSNRPSLHEDIGYSTLTTEIELNITGNIPITIDNSGNDQNIGFGFSNKSITVRARTSGGGACGCGNDMEANINKELVDEVPKQLAGKLNISFNDFSVFALKNLLFPCGNYIKLMEAYLPSDLILLGKFT